MLILSCFSTNTGAGASSLFDSAAGSSCACSSWISTLFYFQHMSIGGIRERANRFPLHPHVADGDQRRAYSDGLTAHVRAGGIVVAWIVARWRGRSEGVDWRSNSY